MVQGAKAGKISKPYGLQGEVQIILNPLIAEYIKEGIPLFIDIDGQRVPFFTEDVELVSPTQAIVKFEFIETVEETRKVCGCGLYFDPANSPDLKHSPEELEEVVGYQAMDVNQGSLGAVKDYLPHAQNPMWILDHRGKELMVPATMDLVRKIDRRKNIITLDLPEGLTDL